ADIGNDNGLVSGEAVECEREPRRRLMRRHVSELELAVLERLDKGLGPQMEGDARERVPALVMVRGADPTFADKQYILFGQCDHPMRYRSRKRASLPLASSIVN